MKIIKKAWNVRDSSEDNGYYDISPDWNIVYAETRNKARTLCDGEYVNIVAKRSKDNDIILYEDREYEREHLNNMIKEAENVKKRRESVLKYPESELFYIQNGWVGNAVLWWALDDCGYTTDMSRVQTYTRQQVLDRFVCGREEDKIWPCSYANKHTKLIIDGQSFDYKFKS